MTNRGERPGSNKTSLPGIREKEKIVANINRKKLDLIFKIIVCVLLVALIGGVTYAIVRVAQKEDTKEISSLAYKIGALDDNGDFVKNTASIVSKDFVSTDGLTIKLQENADVSYKVYFFDTDKAFVSATEAQSADFAGTIPENSKFAKIVITPLHDAEVSIFEMSGYAKQLTVTVNK